jgi:hypothetical protein
MSKIDMRYGSEWDQFCQQHKIEVFIQYLYEETTPNRRNKRIVAGFEVPYFDTKVIYKDVDILNIKTDFPPNDDYLLSIVKPLIRANKINALGL